MKPIALTATQRRANAAAKYQQIHVLAREAMKDVDGEGMTTTEHQMAAAIVMAADDALDAGVQAEATDRTLREIERIS